MDSNRSHIEFRYLYIAVDIKKRFMWEEFRLNYLCSRPVWLRMIVMFWKQWHVNGMPTVMHLKLIDVFYWWLISHRLWLRPRYRFQISISPRPSLHQHSNSKQSMLPWAVFVESVILLHIVPINRIKFLTYSSQGYHRLSNWLVYASIRKWIGLCSVRSFNDNFLNQIR